MKKLASTTGLCLTLALLATPAHARPVTITTKMKPYGGDGAYLALYLTNAQGGYSDGAEQAKDNVVDADYEVVDDNK